MSESIPPPLEPELRDLLRADQPPTAAARERVRARLAASLGIAIGGAAAIAATATATGTATGAAAGALTGTATATTSKLALLAAFVVGAAVGAGLYAGLARPAPHVVYVDRPAASATAVPAAPAPTAPTSTPTATTIPAPASTPTPAATPTASAASESQLSAERRILDQARAALAQGDPQRALDRLARHRRSFPDAMLGEERDAMQVQALVKLGRLDEARVTADALRRRAPGSLFLPMVDAALAAGQHGDSR